MNFWKLVHLGIKNVTQHKKRTILTIISTSALLGLIFSLEFLANGIRNTLSDASLDMTGGKTYLGVEYSAEAMKSSPREDHPHEIEDDIITKATEFGGRHVMTLQHIRKEKATKIDSDATGLVPDSDYNHAHYNVISLEDAKKLFPLENIERSDGTVLTIISLNQAASLHNGYLSSPDGVIFSGALPKTVQDYKREFLDEVIAEYTGKVTKLDDFDAQILYVAGPNSGIEFSLTPYRRTDTVASYLENFNIYNVLLGNGVYGSFYNSQLLVDDGSAEIRNLIENSPRTTNIPVISFDKHDDALRFYDEYRPKDDQGSSQKYTIYEINGSQTKIADSSREIIALLDIVEHILLVVTYVILFATFLRTISDEAPTIATYRALGASMLQIYLIYFVHILTLCVLTIIAATTAGLTACLVASTTSSAALSHALCVFYAKCTTPGLVIGVFSKNVIISSATILLTPFVILLLSLDQFSNRNIAKKLKKSL